MRNSLRARLRLSWATGRRTSAVSSRTSNRSPSGCDEAGHAVAGPDRPLEQDGRPAASEPRQARRDLGVPLVLATGMLFWLSYRATWESQQATGMAVERRLGEALVLAIAALERDMKGVQTSVLLPIHHRSPAPRPRPRFGRPLRARVRPVPVSRVLLHVDAAPNGGTPTSSIAPTASPRGTPRLARWIRTPLRI